MCGTTSTNMNQSIIAYNVKTDTWRSVASRTNTMTAWQNRSGFGYNGKLYISSGYATYDINNQASINNASPSPSYFQYYDIAQETWGANNINKASQSSSQVNYGATNNKVYYIGGEHYTAGTYQSSYWQARRIFGSNRMYSVNLLTGETGIDNAYISTGDTYHLGSGIMVPMGNLLYYMYGHCATSSYYESGNAVWADRIAMYAYDTTANIWTPKPNPPSNYNYNAVYWTLGTKIYVLHTALRALNIFDTTTDTWSLGVAPPSVIASIASFAAKQMPTIGNKAYYFSGSTDNKMFVFDAEVNEGVLLASLNEGNSITSDGTIYLDDGQDMTEYNGGPWFHAEEKDYKVFALGGMPVNGIIIGSDQIPESDG